MKMRTGGENQERNRDRKKNLRDKEKSKNVDRTSEDNINIMNFYLSLSSHVFSSTSSTFGKVISQRSFLGILLPLIEDYFFQRYERFQKYGRVQRYGKVQR